MTEKERNREREKENDKKEIQLFAIYFNDKWTLDRK